MRRLDSVYRNIRSFEVDFDYPLVNSNSSVSQDFSTTQTFPVGTHIIQWGFGEAAGNIEDLIIQFRFVDSNVLRLVLNNPTGGNIDGGTILTQFVTGEFNTDLVETI